MRELKVSRKISRQEVLAFPKKTFIGRDRVSLVPRWIGSWVMTGGVSYAMISIGLGFFGVANPLNDLINNPKKFISSVGGSAVTSTPYPEFVDNKFYASSEGQSIQSTQTAITNYINLTATPPQSTFTPYPTSTPYPTQIRVSSVGLIFAIGYSYYFPPLGGVNCHPDNWHDNYCDDITASGEQWTKYIGRGVAVPVQWADKIPLMSVIRVLDNTVMEGEYTVVDFCGDCIKSEGHIYFDFLDNRPRLNWTVPLLVQIVSTP